MPRITWVTNKEYREAPEAERHNHEPLNDGLDFCRLCWKWRWQIVPNRDLIADEFFDDDTEHPPYDDGERYECHVCVLTLHEADDHGCDADEIKLA